MILPLILALFFLLGYVLYMIVKKHKFRTYFVYVCLIYTFITYQPNIAKAFIDLISPRSVGEKLYIKADMQYEFTTKVHLGHLYTFLLPCLITIIIIIPVSMLLKLFLNRNNLDGIRLMLRWSFLYEEYT